SESGRRHPSETVKRVRRCREASLDDICAAWLSCHPERSEGSAIDELRSLASRGTTELTSQARSFPLGLTGAPPPAPRRWRRLLGGVPRSGDRRQAPRVRSRERRARTSRSLRKVERGIRNSATGNS